MTAAVLTIGTELTRGELQDSNASWLASQLTELGFEVTHFATVDDDRERIVAAIRRTAQNTKVLVVTGGLGPTTDDLTAECAAAVLGVGLKRDENALESIRRRYSQAGRELTESGARQADVPEGSEVLGNPAGTAPAFAITVEGARCFFMPGVPREMQQIFRDLVRPRIGHLASGDSHQLLLRTYGLPEGQVGDRLAGLEEQIKGLVVGYRATFPEVEVKVRVKGPDYATARALAEKAAAEVRVRLGDHVYGEDDDTLAAAVGRLLRARHLTVGVAESCTGGLIGALLTEVPGSSDYLLLDAVTYSNSAKSRVLGVSEEVLIGHGAVSRECAAAMADGVRRVSGSDIGVSVTGVAGPGGGTDAKPVGTVFFGLSTAERTEVVQKRFANLERARVQRAAAFFALSLVRATCLGPVPSAPRPA